jgi:hypothetical protein
VFIVTGFSTGRVSGRIIRSFLRYQISRPEIRLIFFIRFVLDFVQLAETHFQ